MNNFPKRHFYNEKEYILNEEEKKMILLPEFHDKLLNKKLWNKFGFKKIGGSSVGDVLETDAFKSTFGAFARMAWCGVPILDRKYVDAGIAIEPLVVDALKSVMKVDIQTFDPTQYNFDYFEGKDDVIGGIPDGYIQDKEIILEIKTTDVKNYNNWETYGVPGAYLKQAQIYTYLMGVEQYWIVATFLEQGDYENPQNFPIKNRRLKNYKFKLDKFQVQDDIKKIKDWYYKHTQSGVSPEWDIRKDKDLIDYLKCKNEQEYIELLKRWEKEGKYVEKK